MTTERKDPAAPLSSSLAAALENLHKENKEHQEAAEQLRAARSLECAATNRLNAAQRAVDALIEKLKKEAPSNSDWAGRNRGVN